MIWTKFFANIIFDFFKLLFISKFEFSINLISFTIWSGFKVDSLQLLDKPSFLQIVNDWRCPIPKILVKEKKIGLFSSSSVSKIYIIYNLQICVISTNILTLICIEFKKTSGYKPITNVPIINGKKANASRLLISI